MGTLLAAADKGLLAARAATDLGFAAEVGHHPELAAELVDEPGVQAALRDPVFFAVVLCGQGWLVHAPRHQELLRDASPRIVAVCGRGWGKSLTVSLKAVAQYLFRVPRVEVLVASASQRQSMDLFGKLEGHILRSPFLQRFVARKTRTMIALRPPFEGRVEALPCSPNKLRGKHPDVLLVDEASLVPAEMLSGELVYMLTKPEARMILMGTPFGFEHPFRKAFLNPGYKVYHFPSHTSPLVSAAQLREWRALGTEEEWRREVEAEWVELANTYFPLDLIRECYRNPDLTLYTELTQVPTELRQEAQEYSCYAGLDLAKEQDYSVFTVVVEDHGTLKLVFLKQFPRGTPYTEVAEHVRAAYEVFPWQRLLVDEGGPGSHVVEELQRDPGATEGIYLTEANKEQVWTYLRWRMEQRRLALPNHAPLVAQLHEQQVRYSNPKTGATSARLHFYHLPGRHDDMLCSLALSVYAARQEARSVLARIDV